MVVRGHRHLVSGIGMECAALSKSGRLYRSIVRIYQERWPSALVEVISFDAQNYAQEHHHSRSILEKMCGSSVGLLRTHN